MRLFTILVDHRGGTYVRQVEANSEHAAIETFIAALKLSQDSIPQLSVDQLRRVGPSFEVTAVAGVTGVWCTSMLAGDELAIFHVVETVPQHPHGNGGS